MLIYVYRYTWGKCRIFPKGRQILQTDICLHLIRNLLKLTLLLKESIVSKWKKMLLFKRSPRGDAEWENKQVTQLDVWLFHVVVFKFSFELAAMSHKWTAPPTPPPPPQKKKKKKKKQLKLHIHADISEPSPFYRLEVRLTKNLMTTRECLGHTAQIHVCISEYLACVAVLSNRIWCWHREMSLNTNPNGGGLD